MESRIVQISSGQGPAECEILVALLAREIAERARKAGLRTALLEPQGMARLEAAPSALLELEGERALDFIAAWTGTVKWICRSPLRPNHQRKNWFAKIALLGEEEEEEKGFDLKDLKFEAVRASGPGGQHVNKSDTAVRATHIPSGVSAWAQEARSQLQNRKLALARLRMKFAELGERRRSQRLGEARMNHYRLERGNPKLVFTGMEFREAKTAK